MNRKLFLTTVSILSGLAGVSLATALRKRAVSYRREDWPVNFAHRGASARLPENTLEAFRAGLESGAGGLELDVHVTRDGEVVVMHDDTVERTTDGSGPVTEMTFVQVRALEAGYRFGPDGGKRLEDGGGFRVPRLTEVFETFPGTPVNIEIKQARVGDEEIVFRLLRRVGAEGRTLIAASRHQTIRRFRRVAGGRFPTAASRFEAGVFHFLSRLRLEWLVRPSYDALQIPEYHRGIRLLTPRFIEAAHRMGVRVDVWTVDEPSDMRRILDLGADVVMTNRPSVLDGVLRERARDQSHATMTSARESTPKSV